MGKTIRDAFSKSIPVLAGYIVLGIGFGILMNDSGLGVGMTLAMSVLIYAGSMQYVGVGLITANTSIVSAAVTTLIVNARHLFYSISMYMKYNDIRKSLKPYMIFALTDETYSLLCMDEIPEGDDPDFYRFFVSFFDQCYWVIGSLIGAVVGPMLPFDTTGIDFSMTALFIGSFVSQWMGSTWHIPAIVGVVVSAVCVVIFGSGNFLIPAMLIMTLILSFAKEKKENE